MRQRLDETHEVTSAVFNGEEAAVFRAGFISWNVLSIPRVAHSLEDRESWYQALLRGHYWHKCALAHG